MTCPHVAPSSCPACDGTDADVALFEDRYAYEQAVAGAGATDMRLGSLFSGYGGLDMAAAEVFPGSAAVWHCDVKPAACALLAHRFPGVPNVGDITLADWAEVEPVDVLTFGWPCQPHSSAGKRLGEADPRALWPEVARAVRELRPRVLLGENVARVATNGELRRAVSSLAALGYVGAWRCVTAAERGAPHKRDRLALVAIRADAVAETLGGGWGSDLDDVRAGQPDAVRRGDLTLLPTPPRRDGKGPGLREGERPDGAARSFRQLDLPGAVQLLPTPRATDGTKGGWNQSATQGDPSLPAVAALLPTPSVGDGRNSRNATAGRTPENDRHHSGWTLSDVAYADRWGHYAAATERWEHVLGRPAPDPTMPGRNGRPQLAPRFVEWMMGLPVGWVTDVPGLAKRPAGERNAMLSLLGDGVVPAQLAHGFRLALADLVAAQARAA